MYSIENYYRKFQISLSFSLKLFEECNLNSEPFAKGSSEKDFIYSSGILNYIWQMWNNFWKNFWLAYFLGGQDLKQCNIIPLPLFSGLNEKQVIYYILYILHRLNRQYIPRDSIKGSFEEPTWGDVKIITKIASNVSIQSTQLNFIKNNVLNVFSAFGQTPIHLQIVRNACIHLNDDNINSVIKDVIPFYSISKFNYPTEILFSKNLSSNKVASKEWAEDLLALIELIYI